MFRPALALTVLALGAWLAPLAAQAPAEAAPPRLVGFVRDSMAPVRLRNAEVRVVGTRIGALTDDAGRFELEPPPGGYVLEVGSLGYETVRLQLNGVPAAPLRIALLPAAIPLAEVVVTPGHFGVAKEIATPQSMTREDIQTRPQLGEDIYRAVTRLPGVISDDFSARFSIRGGPNDQLLTTLDGVELFEPFHLKDLDASLSIVDVEAVGGVDLVTGGFPADRGDRLTGTFDLRTVDSRYEPARAVFGLSLGNARFLGRGGFAEGRGQWLVSVRRGYLDILLSLVDTEQGIEPRYWDGLAKVEWDASPAHRLGVHFLYADDVGRFVPVEDPNDAELHSRYKSRYGWLTWRGLLGHRVVARTVLSLGELEWVRHGSQRIQDVQRMQVDELRDFDMGGVRQDWTVEHSDQLLTKVGWEWKRAAASYDYVRWEHRVTGTASGTVTRFDTLRSALEPRGHELSMYLAERFRPVARLTIELGGRHDRQTRTRDEEWSPRLNLAWEAARGLSLRAAWGRYAQSQELFQLSVPDGDTAFYPAERAIQRVLGVERTFEDGASVRLELYDRVVDRTRPRYWTLENDIELFPERVFARRRVEPDRMEARGLELFARSRPGKVTGSAGYTLARVRDRIDGVWVADPVDQRHALFVDVGVRPTPAWRLAAAWQYHSGWPITEQRAVVVPLGGQRFNVDRSFGPLNSERLPGYRRVDLRVTRDFRVGRGQLSIFADVFNALDHDNVRGYNWGVSILDQTGRFQMIRYPIELLPRLPSVGASYQF